MWNKTPGSPFIPITPCAAGDKPGDLWRSILCIGLLLLTGVGRSQAEEKAATFETTLKPFLSTYCTGCHGAKQQKGERRFDVLPAAIDGDNTLIDYQDILDQLNLGNMPPEEAKQPTNADRRKVTEWLTRTLETYHRTKKSTGGETVLRRLNSREYRNTVRDLLHLDMTMFDPTAVFPRDQLSEHLDNVGGTLVTSGHLLAKYLAAADLVVQKAMRPLEKPAVQTWTFKGGFRQQPEIDQVFRKTNKFAWMTLLDVVGADKHEGAYGPIHAFAEGVPYDGYYDIRIKAEAVNRINPYDPEFLGLDPAEPFRLGIVAGNKLAGPLHKPQPIEPLLAEVDLADEQKWYTLRVWMDQGYTPRFTFRNGLMDVRNLYARLIRKYEDQFPPRKRPGIVENRFNAITHGKLPQIRIHEIEITGPFYDQWPTESQRAILGEHSAQILKTRRMSESQMRKQLSAFASRAYRRPAQAEEIDRILDLIAARKQSGRSDLEAYADGLKAVLCSPSFLYLEEPGTKGLSSHALASRLSYFLWSSMPDEVLMKLAEEDKLSDSKVLEAQVERMLDDPKSEAFLDGFLASWLTLRDLGSMPPDRSQFSEFYHYDLDSAMRQETKLFTRHLIEQNLSVDHFLDADFTFLNKRLAKHYGIEGPKGWEFERVELSDGRRGGLLGQASVHTVTANGIDTSPVVRGVWLLENILGTPPSPPPPDVEPLDPDIRGATTIREQLKKHASVASCYDCHRSIDPLGFALENFDPVGRWRESYGKQGKIDASGELPNGKRFRDVSELKKILLEQKHQFAAALTGKLLAYALGRHTEPGDRPHIDRILKELDERNDGFRDLITRVVLSEPFRSK